MTLSTITDPDLDLHLRAGDLQSDLDLEGDGGRSEDEESIPPAQVKLISSKFAFFTELLVQKRVF